MNKHQYIEILRRILCFDTHYEAPVELTYLDRIELHKEVQRAYQILDKIKTIEPKELNKRQQLVYEHIASIGFKRPQFELNNINEWIIKTEN